MKVWIVHRDVMYDGGETLHICETRQKAINRAKKVMKRDAFHYKLKRADERVAEWEWMDYTVTVHDVEVE